MKHVYIIAYQPKLPAGTDRTYYDVLEKIKSLGSWQHPMDQVWFVKTESPLNLTELCGEITELMKWGDLFVTEVGEAFGGYMPNAIWPWLRDK